MQETPLEWSTGDPQPEVAEFLLKELPDMRAAVEQGQQPHPIIGFEAARRIQLVKIARKYGYVVGPNIGDVFDEGTPHPTIVSIMNVMFQQGKFNGAPVPIPPANGGEEKGSFVPSPNNPLGEDLSVLSYNQLRKAAKARGINTWHMKRSALEEALA